MYTAIGYAAQSATTPLAPMTFNRRSPRPDDVAIEILYCGVCHSDIHQARNEWGIAVYPLMPGHEIVGKVTEVGAKVSKHKVGDLVGGVPLQAREQLARRLVEPGDDGLLGHAHDVGEGAVDLGSGPADGPDIDGIGGWLHQRASSV